MPGFLLAGLVQTGNAIFPFRAGESGELKRLVFSPYPPFFCDRMTTITSLD